MLKSAPRYAANKRRLLGVSGLDCDVPTPFSFVPSGHVSAAVSRDRRRKSTVSELRGDEGAEPVSDHARGNRVRALRAAAR